MIYHILNGDGLAGKFKLEGEVIVCRECLIEGDLKTESLADFWKTRAEFIKQTDGDASYPEKVKREFERLNQLNSDDEVNLWFGNEAFCQVNQWFCLSLSLGSGATFYRVFPDSEDWNCGFEKLENCLDSRQKLSEEDLKLGQELWEAFCHQDFESLKDLGERSSKCFKRLDEVCQALIEKDFRPKEILNEITETGESDFAHIFTQFQARAEVYGFGDLQVKNLLSEI